MMKQEETGDNLKNDTKAEVRDFLIPLIHLCYDLCFEMIHEDRSNG